nr:response regulator [Calditrichia bacterium]
NQKIEFILWQPGQAPVKFAYNTQIGQMAPVAEFRERNTLYNFVLERQKTVLTNNYPIFCKNLNLDAMDLPASAWIGVPIKVRDKVLGAVVIWDEDERHYFRLQDRQFLNSTAQIAGFALENQYLSGYIAEKNGSMKIFDQVSPTATPGNSTRRVIEQLLNSVVLQHNVRYAGVFLRSRQKNRWRLLNEHFQDDLFSETGLGVLEGLHKLPKEPFLKHQQLFWHQERGEGHMLQTSLGKLTEKFPVNAFMLLPFQVNNTFLGAFVVAFQRDQQQLSREEQQLLQFIFYVIAQLIEKKVVAEQQKKTEGYLQHLERMKVTGELASGTAHHLNNILSVIIGKGQLLQRSLAGTDYERDIKVLLQAAADGAKSIDRLQRYASHGEMDEGGESSALNLNFLVQEVVEIARPRFEGEAQSRGIHYELDLTLGETLPVLGDAPALREVILNLINNALDAMPRGGKLSIQTTLRNDRALVFVSDTGIGIPEEIRSKIFEPFYTTKGKQGNGLGLSIAAEIMRKHNGKIFVDSIARKGSIFMLEFPTASGGDVTMPETPEVAFFQRLGYKVLLVEDEGIVRETLTEMLEEEGCEVLAANSARDALLKFQKFTCDVVFADLSMPGMNGVELAGKLKQINPTIPVFIVTGWNKADVPSGNGSAAIDGIIHKPFDIEKIRLELVRAVNRR